MYTNCVVVYHHMYDITSGSDFLHIKFSTKFFCIHLSLSKTKFCVHVVVTEIGLCYSDTELIDESYSLYGVKLPVPRGQFPAPAIPSYDSTRSVWE